MNSSATADANVSLADAGLLNIQVHLERAQGLDVNAFRLACDHVVQAGHALRLSFVHSDDDGPHIDACFESFNANELWSEISAFLFSNPHWGQALCSSCVVARTGAQGWDDYQLLRSYCQTSDAQ
jgi:hypothetical protein